MTALIDGQCVRVRVEHVRTVPIVTKDGAGMALYRVGRRMALVTVLEGAKAGNIEEVDQSDLLVQEINT